MADDYDQFRNHPGCGWQTGTVYTGPTICGKTAKHTATVDPDDIWAGATVNGLVCGIHARAAANRSFTVTPIEKG